MTSIDVRKWSGLICTIKCRARKFFATILRLDGSGTGFGKVLRKESNDDLGILALLRISL